MERGNSKNYKKTILIIEDEELARDQILRIFQDSGYSLLQAEGISNARKIFRKQSVDMVLLDNHLTEIQKGVDYIEEIKNKSPSTQVIMLTRSNDTDLIIDAIKKGAFYFVSKPFNPQEVRILVEKALALSVAEKQQQTLITKNHMLELQLNLEKAPTRQPVIGNSGSVQQIINQIQRVNDSGADVSLFLTGESGVGKEVFAKYINQDAQTKMNVHRPFVAINCTSIQPTLFESEFFGFEKGAFTGAGKQKIGFFELAEGGDLFLDEIGDMPLEFQAKILRVLQEKEITRVGGTTTISVNFRLISATNRNLKDMIKEGTFREDLYYRISSIDFEIPPLRERASDIPQLIQFFMNEMSIKTGRTYLPFPSHLLDLFQNYQWPGNIRQLKSVVDKLLILGFDGQDYDETYLSKELIASNGLSIDKNGDNANGEEIFRTYSFFNAIRKNQQVDMKKFVLSFEKYILKQVLAMTHNNKQKTGELLSLKKSTLYSKIDLFKLAEKEENG